ncbi:hypothetical protein BGX27_006216 [Mortierella sp. AM989]|nr:hypothetical protein BGX27_006216 [Mortierella sp. AM989]
MKGDAHNEHDRRNGRAKESTPFSSSASPSASPRISKTADSSRTLAKPQSPRTDNQPQESQSSGYESTFKPVYPYPENKDVIVWELKDPKKAITTTVSTLDTRANMSSGSIMSRTRRIMDQKAKQRQIDIQRDFSGQQDRASPAVNPNKSTDGVNKADDSSMIGSRKSSQRGSSPHISFQDSISPTNSPTLRSRGQTSYSKSNHSRDGGSKGPSSRKQLQRALSGPIFISNPRGVAPTPSPDISLDLIRNSSRSRGRDAVQIQERMRRYEAQLDQRNETVLANNQRLVELKLLLESQDRALVIRAQDDEYEDDDDEEWEEEQMERERERGQLIEANVLLEESQILQQQLKKDLEQEQEANKDLDSRIQQMSDRLKELLELGEAQAAELRQVRQQADKEREQWERQLFEERHKQEQLQTTIAASLTNQEREMADETAKQRSANQAEIRKLASDVTSLNQHIQELEGKLRRQEDMTQAAVSEQADQAKEHQRQIQKLEKKLANEQDRLSEDQEARARVRMRVNELAQSVEQKEDEVHELRGMLEERDELLDRRQAELDDALSLAHTLEDQLREQQAESQENQRREQEKHVKELRQQKSELRDTKHKLTGEKESTRQLEKRIQLLLESHQESNQINETKIQQLEEELEKRRLQLAQFSSTSSSATSTIHQLQGQIEDQERMLLEKEDRVQELEQELKLAQQQAQSVVADLEQDVLELENDRSKLDNLLQKAHQEADEARMKIKELELQLNSKDQELSHELNQRHDQEQLLLERLLNDMETAELTGDQEERYRESQFTNECDSADGSVQYFYSRLQEKIKELRQERLRQDRSLEEMRQQLDQCNAEIDTQQEQLMRMENDRKSLEGQLVRLQDDLAMAEQSQQQLRQQLQRKEQDVREGRTIPRVLSSSTSRKQQQQQQRRHSHEPSQETEALESEVQRLKEQMLTLEKEKQLLLEELEFTQDQLQNMEGTIQDQNEAAKSIRSQYMEKIRELQAAVTKLRKMVVKQEGQLFLYLSVIEKLKLEKLELEKRGQTTDGEHVAAV